MYLVKTSITHNKYLTFWLKKDNNLISVKSAAEILSLNLAKNFRLLNFLIIGLCNFPVSSSFTLAQDLVFLSKYLSTIFANPQWHPSYSEFIAIS